MGEDTRTVQRAFNHWRHSQRFRLITASTAMYLVGALLIDRIALRVGLSLDASTGLVLALAIVFGPMVAVGAGLGHVITDLLTGTFGLHSAFGYAATFLLVFMAVAFWNSLGRYRPFQRGLWYFLRFVLAALPAVLTAAAVEAWGSEILARAPFATVFLTVCGDAVGGVAIGLIVLPLVRYLSRAGILSEVADREPELVLTWRWMIVAAVVPILWGALGTLLSVAFQPLQLEHPQILANRFGWTAVTIVDLVGPAGRNVQFLLGLLGITVFTIAVGTMRRP